MITNIQMGEFNSININTGKIYITSKYAAMMITNIQMDEFNSININKGKMYTTPIYKKMHNNTDRYVEQQY